MTNKNTITVESIINAPIEKVWEYWNEPKHITKWAFASDDWEAPHAENDVKVGGRFLTVMAAKDGSSKFDFGGVYTAVRNHELIEYTMDEVNRHVKIEFNEVPEGVKITQTFDPENINSEEMQRNGWQSILNNFKKYAENNSGLSSSIL
jgi:uncharacterized protein YndB with AHSA1/START domain